MFFLLFLIVVYFSPSPRTSFIQKEYSSLMLCALCILKSAGYRFTTQTTPNYHHAIALAKPFHLTQLTVCEIVLTPQCHSQKHPSRISRIKLYHKMIHFVNILSLHIRCEIQLTKLIGVTTVSKFSDKKFSRFRNRNHIKKERLYSAALF